MVERRVRDAEVAGSSPVIPTHEPPVFGGFFIIRIVNDEPGSVTGDGLLEVNMKEFLKNSFRTAMPLFIGLTLSVICFFLIYRYDGLSKSFSTALAILRPFVYGGVMAYLLKTPYNWTMKKLSGLLPEKKLRLVRGLSLVFVLMASLIIITVLLVMVIPALADSIRSIARSIPSFMNEQQYNISKYTDDNPEIKEYIDQGFYEIEKNGPNWLRQTVLPMLTGAVGGVVGIFGSVVGVLYNLLIGLIVCIYILLSKETFGRQAKMLVYSVFRRDRAEKVLDEFVFIDRTFVGFFGGKILDSAIVGLICYVFCLILQLTLGMHNAVLVAVIVGVTNIIPFFGPYIGAIPSALIILMDSPLCCIIFVIFVILLQLFDGNVLGPMLLSESVGLSGFWVLFSITAFGGLMGIVGIIIGVPVFAVIYDLIKRWVYMMLRKNGATEYLPEAGVPEGDKPPGPEELV